jgi:Fe-Mn family superoxide dismutase
MDSTRRDLLKVAGGVLMASSVIGAPLAMAAVNGKDRQKQATTAGAAISAQGGHVLPPLPYAPDALEPHIDARTMELHHDKHHAGYVRGLNKAEEMLAAARDSGDYSMIQHWERQAAFHGAGHFLHSLFWKIMAKPGTTGVGEPYGLTATMIDRDFGSFKQFMDQFSAATGAVEGSGWGILGYRPVDQRLVVLQIENHQKLSQMFVIPILCLDVWEHAYYLKYQNKRADYVAAWWNVVNWPEVEANLKAAV